MTVKTNLEKTFNIAILDEFTTNPYSIKDFAEYVGKNAARDTKDAIDILTRGRKYLKDKMLTIKVTVEFGDSSDFEDEKGGDE